MTEKNELEAEIDAVWATVKAKLAAGIEIKNPGFEGTREQRMEWIVYRGMTIDPAKRRRVCNLPRLDPELFAEAVAQAELKQIKRQAETLVAPEKLIPELQKLK